MKIELFADEADAQPPDDEYLEYVYFRDRDADYVFSLSRFADESMEDDGKIEVLVRDQIHTTTDKLSVQLSRATMTASFDDETATKLGGVHVIVAHFQVDAVTYDRIRNILQHLFRSIPGYVEIES